MKLMRPGFLSIFVIPLLFLLAQAGYVGEAGAAPATPPAIDSSCFNMGTYGFSMGLVTCVETSIGTAVTQYVTSMQTYLRPYEGMMALVAVVIFGFKMMQGGLREPLKDSLKLLGRLAIGVFFYENSSNIYQWIAGNDGIMNEAIGWITGTGSGGGSGNAFTHIIANNCSTDTLPTTTYAGYQVWQAFDCMFMRILGAANPANHPFAFGTSLLVIIAASLFSATKGLTLMVLGITLFVNALLLVFRALYLVLISYFCVGLMTIFGPVFAPMLFFENQMISEKFRNWIGIILSCIFQPVLVIGFLAMTVAIDDQLMEGTFTAAQGCVLPTPISSGTMATAPAAGWGQDGSGVCSFTQLFNQGAASGADIQTIFHDLMEPNSTIASNTTTGNVQEESNTTTPVDPNSPQFTHGSSNVSAADPQQQQGASLDWNAATRLREYAPVKQLLLTLITFIFVTYVMRHLLERIPSLAADLTLSVAAPVFETGGFQNSFSNAMNKLEESAKGAIRKRSASVGSKAKAAAAQQKPMVGKR